MSFELTLCHRFLFLSRHSFITTVLLTAVSTTWRRVTSPPSSNRRATLVTGSVYARCRRPSSMFLAPNTWPSVAVHSVQLQLVCGTVCQRQCSLWVTGHFRCRLKTELFERSYNWHRACQMTLLLHDSLSLSRSFLLWPQPWSLSAIMLLWHSFLIIIIMKGIQSVQIALQLSAKIFFAGPLGYPLRSPKCVDQWKLAG